MISTLAELNAANEASHFDENVINNLSAAELAAIQSEIHQWDGSQLTSLADMLNDYYDLVEVPASILKSICQSDLDLALEVFNNATRDTCVRERFIDKITKYVGSTNWPCYGDSQQYTSTFFKEFGSKCAANGIKYAG